MFYLNGAIAFLVQTIQQVPIAIAPTIYALLNVSNHEDIALSFYLANDFLLDEVCILIFINENTERTCL